MNQLGGKIWRWNHRQEMISILDCVKKGFRYIAIDTEFPGCLKETPREANNEQRYKDMKFNVERTKVIQLGLTLFDPDGRIGGTWEVNFCDFDETEDLMNLKSVDFLKRNGLNLKKIRDEGVKANEFFKGLSWILCDKDMVWVTFQGSYDLAYMAKGFTGEGVLPDNSKAFGYLTNKLFGEVHDVKKMAGRCLGSKFKRFGLQKLADAIGISRFGDAHHAGSDSELTSQVFAKMSIMEDAQRLQDDLAMEGCHQQQPGSWIGPNHPAFVDRHFGAPVPTWFQL